ncbi:MULTISPECIES: alpha/beta hydrolase [Clostridium]|uniref:Alpha/beta hydrolase n=1 Tax=Clostridium aquiflavi TaxID=3073603 RepID=A0ABU1EHH0_9CLOT|nr:MULTISPECIES: alpha/beta hydrolase [unclassified Clostridium]MDR5587845.1 alpha/beta hydrolase [Clostridium sp. 5N-1]NFG61412.1 alpha/beta hydrolase [Clostridium botulinum]NFQ10394.1 alpha/beta hydrolase [Clostridium botulinum]
MEDKIILTICIALLIIIILLIFAGNYFYNFSLNPNISKDKVFDSNKNFGSEVVKKDETSGEDREEDREWILNTSKYNDIYIKSFDDLNLHGYQILYTNNSQKWVVMVHGYTGEGMRMGSRAKAFYEMGYNIVIPDLRGHGKSEGNYIGMGWHDRKDIIEWINYIVNKDKESEILLYGISMGASTVMMTSGENLPSNVKAIIEDCGYTSAWDEFSYQLKSMFKLPKFPIMYAASVITKMKSGYFLKEASAIKQVSKSKTPILFIHGEEDKFVPYFMLDKVYNAAKCEKEILIVKEAGHCKAHKVNPDLYWNTIKKFVDKYINSV